MCDVSILLPFYVSSKSHGRHSSYDVMTLMKTYSLYDVVSFVQQSDERVALFPWSETAELLMLTVDFVSPRYVFWWYDERWLDEVCVHVIWMNDVAWVGIDVEVYALLLLALPRPSNDDKNAVSV